MRLSVDFISVVGGKRLGGAAPRGSAANGSRAATQAGFVLADSNGLLNFRAKKGKLIVFAAPDLPAGTEPAPLVVNWIAADFHGDSSPSITSSLTRALLKANSRLAKSNLDSLAFERRYVAVACVVLREQELYLAQVGPLLALCLREGQLAFIGDSSGAERDAFYGGLGRSGDPAIKLSREMLMAGDVFLLCTPSLLHSVDGPGLAACLQQEDCQDILTALYRLHQNSPNPEDFSASVIVVEAPRAVTASDRPPPGREVDRALRRASFGMASSARKAAEMPWSPRRSGLFASWPKRDTEDQNDSGQAIFNYRDNGNPPFKRLRLVTEPAIGEQDRLEVPAQPNWRPPRRENRRAKRQKEQLEAPRHIANRRPEDFDDEQALNHLSARRTKRTTSGKRVLLYVLLPLLLFAVVVGSIVLLVRGYQAKELEGQAASLVEQLTQTERDAEATADIIAKRRLLSQADQLANQVVAAKPGDQAALAARERVRKELDELSAGLRVTAHSLIDLGQESTDADPARIIVQGSEVYVLDKGSERIYKYLLDAAGEQVQPVTNPVLVRKRDRVGGTEVERIDAMAWMPAGGSRLKDDLVFADDNGQVYEYEAQKGIAPLKIATSGWPQGIKALGGYAGSLYVLAPKSNKLVWILPTPRGYENQPFDYLNPDTPNDWSTAVDFTVSSSVFVLHSNGTVRRFYAGRPQDFDNATPDVPLKSPISIYSTQLGKSVYVVDAGNQRIVQFSKEGHYERQIRYGGADNAFQNLKGVSVDEQRGKLYFVAGKKVYVADLSFTQ